MNRPARALFLTLMIVIITIALMNVFSGGPIGGLGAAAPEELTVGQLLERVKNGEVDKVEWQESDIRGTFKDGRKFVATGPTTRDPVGQALFNELIKNEVNVDTKTPPISQTALSLISMFAFPVIMVLILWFFFLRPSQAGGNQALSFGRSRAKRVGEGGPKVTFDDVAGIEEAKQELWEIVDFLKNTKRYTALGAKIPKGILLTGPPGVGKTHLARAIAGEAGVPFFHISGSDFVEMFVGVGAARVRDLFETAKAHRPSLIFIDEIDAVGRQRGAGLGGGHDEREQTLNQLLVEMDGFDPNSGVIMIAATNRPDVLDPALLRPGRFDRQIVVDPPDAKGREQILRIHARGKPMDASVDLEVLSKRTPGFTGADLANMLNEAALLAARRNHPRILQEDLEEALDRVIAGPQRKSRVMDAKEREVIAYHEAGHAIVGETLPYCDPVHKVTILPRGMSLGSTWSLPVTDKYLVSEQELHDDLAELLGGRVAEELVFNEVTTGASNDLQRVTRIARAMVCEYGMSEKLGTLVLGRRNQNPFLGRDYTMDERNYSEAVAELIDQEVRAIVERARQRATEILMENREKLDRVVQALLEHETLDREAFLAAMEGREIPKREPKDDAAKEQQPEAEEQREDRRELGRQEPAPGFLLKPDAQ